MYPPRLPFAPRWAPRLARFALVAAVGSVACSQAGTTQTGTVQSGVGSGSNVPVAGSGNATTAQNQNQGTAAQQGNAVASPNVVAQQPNGPAVQFLGRFDTVTDPNLTTMAWPGTQIRIGFDGTKLAVTLVAPDAATYDGVAQNCWISASVDGGNETLYKLPQGRATYTLAQNLPTAHHEARITLRTEAQMGRVSFVSATTDGKLSYTTPVPTRRIEFVGDSGAAGYGADGNYPCTFSAATENALVAYPMVVGQLLGAEVRDLSFSGKGLVQNRDMVSDAYKTLPVLWQRTLPFDNPYVVWDANAWRPQVVVLITGGNDFYVDVPDATTYAGKVNDFIAILKAAYPGVRIYLGASPMLRDDSHPTQRETAIGYLKSIATAAGDPNVLYLDIPGPDLNDPNAVLGANGFGCDEHPSPATHRKVAQSIAATLKAQLGW